MAKKFNDTEYRLLLDILPTPLLHIKQLPKLLFFKKLDHSRPLFLYFSWAVVVAKLVEWSIPIPEVCSSNPVIGKKLY